MAYLLVVGAVFIAVIAVTLVSSVRKKRKLEYYLRKNFGKNPERKYDSYIMESIGSYWRNSELTGHCVDSLTWRDLDMDSVFKRINNTCSSIGEEYLYKILHDQTFDYRRNDGLEEAVRYFDSHPDERLRVQVALSKLGKVTANGIYEFFLNPEGKALSCPNLYPVLCAASVISILSLIPLGPTGIFLILLMAAVNILVYHRSKYGVESEITTMRYVASLIACAGKLSLIPAEELKEYRERLAALRAPLRKIGRLAGAVMNNSSGDLDFLLEYVKIFFMVDFLMYRRMISTMKKHSQECMEIYRIVGLFDTAVAVASFRKSVGAYCLPEFTESNEIVIRGMVHPLILKPVANSVTLSRNSIITGSNASGKSTFVKAVAINTILAQSIHTCLAEAFRLKPSFVVTSMAVSDSIEEGDSYYIAEIKSLKRILDGMNKNIRCLCFIDEILKGTNTIERIAASASVLDYLKSENCLAVVATHDIELTEMAESAFDNYHFQEHIDENGVHFDYLIYEGRATTKNAIKLLEVMDYPAEITKKAETMACEFEKNRAWQRLSL